MGKTERLYTIERLIRERGCVSFDTLLDALEVSPATLKRDLQYLRDRMSAPIEYDRFENGYHMAEEKPGTRHELPGLWFSEKELYALLTAQQLLGGLDDDGVLSRHLKPLQDRLHAMLGSGEPQAKELMARVKIVPSARRPVPARFFELMGAALMQRRRVRMRYYTRGTKTISEREVSPQRLAHYRNTWYLDAWCHRTEGLRRFALDAIEDATALDEPAKEIALDEVEAELDGGYGIFGGRTVHWATLHFSAEAAPWVCREEWHPRQETRWLDDGRYELKLPYSDATELAMDLMRHAEQVTVMPGSGPVLDLVAERLKGAAGRYVVAGVVAGVVEDAAADALADVVKQAGRQADC